MPCEINELIKYVKKKIKPVIKYKMKLKCPQFHSAENKVFGNKKENSASFITQSAGVVEYTNCTFSEG